MRLILDTDVLIRAEKQAAELDFRCWASHGDACISAITVLTANVADFDRMPGVVLVPFESAT